MAMIEHFDYVAPPCFQTLPTHTYEGWTHIYETIINSPSQLSAALPPHLYVILQKHALAYLSAMLSSFK